MKKIALLTILLMLSTQTLADDSIYHIDSAWINQDKKSVKIEQLSGKIQIIAFVYTYCEHSCPIIMSRLKQIEKHLPEGKKTEIHFSLFSLDPIRDTPEQLKLFAKKHGLNLDVWGLHNGDPDDVLELAALVGVRYKPMNNGNNDIAHSNMITVLDKQGAVIHQVKGFGEDLKTVLSVIEAEK
jgi:protein SCO1/2